MARIVGQGDDATTGQIPFTPRAKKVLELALREALSLGHNYIGTEHILLGLVRETPRASPRAPAQVRRRCRRRSGTRSSACLGPGHRRGGSPGGVAEKSKRKLLDQFGRNLTELAEEGKLDPVIGRQKEIERIMQILSRQKNNPVVLGEPGVGKTAIVEGLAQQIRERRARAAEEAGLGLDLAAVLAGTKYRGEFEKRMKTVIKEVVEREATSSSSSTSCTRSWARGQPRARSTASNILKPALARGELQCIGATTLDEYRKYIERTAPWSGGSSRCIVDEPSRHETVEILTGLRDRYEAHHRMPDHGRCDPRGGRSCRRSTSRTVPAGQGDRRDRRGLLQGAPRRR